MVKDDMNIVIVGHVDHGKSTVIGRMLADTDSLPDGKLDAVRENCKRNSKPFEYAFLLDALKDEQAQGITIDSARVFFQSERRNYIIIDAPGHIEFLKNMVSGAARAEAALLVIDAKEGVRENSKRHGYMLSMLGIDSISVIVNKMDLVDYSEEHYNSIVSEYTSFLEKIEVKAKSFIPVSAVEGENIMSPPKKMPWYKGLSVLQTLDEFTKRPPDEKLPMRMPVQDVYKFTKNHDNRRIVAGTLISGKVKVGDEVIFYPSGKRSKVSSLERFNAQVPQYFKAQDSAGFTLDEQIYVKRGELAVLANEKAPTVSSKIKANIFWLGKSPMELGKSYSFKLGTTKTPVSIERIDKVLDASTLGSENKDRIDRHDVAECVLKTEKPVAFDAVSENRFSSRFVIVDEYNICGGGIVTGAEEDENAEQREKVFLRERKWVRSGVDVLDRSERFGQKPSLIIITGEKDTGKKRLAKALERELFRSGRLVYYLGIGSVLYGLDADIKSSTSKVSEERNEHIRRVGELANILLNTGHILIVTAVGLSEQERVKIRTGIDPALSENIYTFWVGKKGESEIHYHRRLERIEDEKSAALELKEFLAKDGLFFSI